MSNNNSNSKSSGVGFLGLLQLALIILKLCDVINSWWVVFIPIYICIIVFVLVLTVIKILNRRIK